MAKSGSLTQKLFCLFSRLNVGHKRNNSSHVLGSTEGKIWVFFLDEVPPPLSTG